MLRNFLIVAIFTLFFAGCKSYVPPVENLDLVKEKTFQADYEKVWSALVQWYAENDMSIDLLEKESGLIRTEWFKPCEQCKDCGFMKYNEKWEASVRVRINMILIKKNDGSCILTINQSYKEVPFSFGGRPVILGYVECFSNGLYEYEIFEYIDEKL